MLSLIREKSILIWALGFPSIILATLFGLMFSNFDESFEFKPIATAIIEDTSYQNDAGFSQMMETLSKPGDDQILDLHSVKSISEAEQLVKDGKIVGYFLITDKGNPQLFVTSPRMDGGIEAMNQTILKNLLDNYLHTRATLETLVKENPMALTDPTFAERLSDRANYTKEISITANNSSHSVRNFYALLGFAAIMAAMVSMTAVTRTQANLSALGARRAVGATSRTKTLTATLLAAWMLSFACLVIAYCYMRFVLGINFGRDAAGIFGLFVASLISTSLGAFIGALPKSGDSIKGGILMGLSCLFGLFAGLYGPPTQRLADEAARTAPLLQTINPSRQVTELFYSLYYFDGYEHFFQTVFILFAIAVVLFLAATIFMRRQRYASL